MRATRGTSIWTRFPLSARGILAPVLLLATVAAPGAVRLWAKDKPAKEGKGKDATSRKVEAVAKKTTDDTNLATSPIDEKTVLTPALDAARTSLEAVKKLPGYSATFTKQERLKKGLIQSTMTLKFRREPFSVYLKYTEPHEGRQVIFVDGKNKGKLVAREASGIASFAGWISLSPTGDEALKENRYPVSMIGMEKMLESFIEQLEEEQKHPESELQIYPDARIGDRNCRMFEIVHTQQQPHFKFHKQRLFIDKRLKLPVRIESYGFPAKAMEEPPLVEEYMYSDIVTEVELTDLEFDIKNPGYSAK